MLVVVAWLGSPALPAVSCRAEALATPDIGGERSGDLVLLYHPLHDGTTWVYRIEEEGRSYEQRIELRREQEPGRYALVARSPMRRTRYVISREGNRILLHSVAASLPLLPFHRTKSFDPPVPFLWLDADLENHWSWNGSSRGPGPSMSSAEYELVESSERPWPGSGSGVVVRATARTEEGVEESYRARYDEGIGLVCVESAGYRKELVEFRAADPESPGR